MNYISLFAGIGGFDLALNRASHICVYVNEWDKFAAQTYEKNFGHKPDTRSITDVHTDEIPDHELLVGGFPCQSFSIAGKRAGFNDTRGTLFFDVARILKHKRPRYFILENVKGLLSHDSGKTFSTILGVLTELGYEYQWQVLNSKDFGVPQNRERVFIVGHLRGQPRPKIFPIRESYELRTKTCNPEKQAVAAALGAARGGADITDDLILSPTIRANHHNTADVHFLQIGAKVRRLTPTECERLQGFPNGWTEGVSDTQRYKQLGNAVTVSVVQSIINRLTSIT